jgi:hypothetical protein
VGPTKWGGLSHTAPNRSLHHIALARVQLGHLPKHLPDSPWPNRQGIYHVHATACGPQRRARCPPSGAIMGKWIGSPPPARAVIPGAGSGMGCSAGLKLPTAPVRAGSLAQHTARSACARQLRAYEPRSRRRAVMMP